LDLTGVLLKEAVVAVVTGELELLVLIELTRVEHESSDGFCAMQNPLHRRTLPGDIVGEIIQPPWIIVAGHAAHLFTYSVKT